MTTTINWTAIGTQAGAVGLGVLTIISQVPGTPIAAAIPAPYQPYVIAAGVLATLILQAVSKHSTDAALHAVLKAHATA